MKKKLIVVCFLAAIVAAGIALTACGDKYADSPYVGTWNATTADYNGMEIKVESLLGEFKMTIKADGTCDVLFGGEEKEGNWEPSENGFIIDSQSDMEFISDNGKLYVNYSGVVIHFEKE